MRPPRPKITNTITLCCRTAQPSLLHSPLTDSLVATDEPLTRPCVDSRDAAYLAITAYHPKVRLKASNDAIFGVY